MKVAPALVGALKDREASVRSEAALSLGRYLIAASKSQGAALNEQARAAAAGLIEMIRQDGDSSARASAAFAAASLVRALRDAGLKADKSNGDDPIDPRAMVKAFNAALEQDPASRLALLVPYQNLGPIDEPAPSVLLDALGDPEQNVRGLVLQVLSQFASGVDKAVPVLLSDAEHKLPPTGLQVTKGAGPGSPLRQAAEHLRPSAAAVPVLAKSLESQNPDVRSVAVILLGRVGLDARPAAGTLITEAKAMIQSSRDESRSGGPTFSDYANALVQILPAGEAVLFLSEAIGIGRRSTRIVAASALGKLGSAGQAAIPNLLKALKEAGDSEVGRRDAGYTAAILQSLGEIAPDASLANETTNEIIDTLGGFLDSAQVLVRIAAARALGRFGPRASSALPRLRALNDNEQAPAAAREAASEAIKKIELKEKLGTH
jgi:HEAT repeat protein